MKLHWSPRSPYVRKAMITAYESGVVEQISLVRSVAAMREPNAAIMADNPLSKIPTLVLDDGSAVYDSLTICEYFDRIGQPGLFPEKPAERLAALTLHALANGLMDILILWRNERSRPSEKQDGALIAAYEIKLTAGLDRLDPMVAEWGDAFNIGHIAVGCMLSYLDFRYVERDWRQAYPALTQWLAAFCARPSVIATEVADD